MSRSGSRPSARVGLAALLLAVAASGCSASNPTPKTPKPAILPASARIVRTVDFVLPPVPLPPSAKPDAGVQSVVFLNASTGFVASGGQPLGTDQGGVYLPDPGGIERTGDGGKTWTTAWTAPGALLTWIGFAGPITGFAAGIQFETSSGTSSTSRPLLLRTTNAGITFTISDITFPPIRERQRKPKSRSPRTLILLFAKKFFRGPSRTGGFRNRFTANADPRS